MRLTVTHDGKLVNEAQFVKGPIHIGRHPQCQVFLASPLVSRQHAVIYLAEQGQWIVKDMHSGNKTMLNGLAVDHHALKDRDRIGVGDYTIEIHLDPTSGVNLFTSLADTHVPLATKPRLLTRELDDELAPPLRVPAMRTRDLLQAVRLLTQARGDEDTLKVLLDILRKQFKARRVWAAFRHDSEGPMAAAGGRMETGAPFVLSDPALRKRVEKARAERCYYLLAKEEQTHDSHRLRSAIMAPIPGTAGNLGAFYIDSHPQDIPFAPTDLDYALLLSIDIGIVFENF